MITRDIDAFIAVARTLKPDFGPATARAAFLVSPDGFVRAEQSALDNRYMADAGAFDADAGPARLLTRGDFSKADYVLRVDVTQFEAQYNQGPKAAPESISSASSRVELWSSSSTSTSLSGIWLKPESPEESSAGWGGGG